MIIIIIIITNNNNTLNGATLCRDYFNLWYLCSNAYH